MKIIVKNRSGQDMSHMGSYLKSFLPYVQKRMGFNRPPAIFFDSDPQNAENVLGKTAYYNPETEEIVVFVDKRHPKDILRSLSHELVHHSQNCRGDLNPEIAGETTPGYAQTNAHMRAMEGEAYLKGNGYYFRDWEDSLKNGLEETNYKHITGDSHKMATYEQLKEDITKKVVAALTEKLNEGKKKPDGDGDGVPPWADKDDNDPKVQEEAVEEGEPCGTCGSVEDRAMEAMKAVHDLASAAGVDLQADVSGPGDVEYGEDEEKLDEYGQWTSSDYGPDAPEFGGHGLTPSERQDKYEKDKKRKEKKAADAKVTNSAKFQRENEELEEAQEEKVVEEAISNDQWYQSELFESLKKRWTK